VSRSRSNIKAEAEAVVSLLHHGTTEVGLRRTISADFADYFGTPVAEADMSRVATQIMSWRKASMTPSPRHLKVGDRVTFMTRRALR
jgi:hypothetical protein